MGAKVGLDRTAVVDAAVALAEEGGGLGSAGLRPLADRLGVRVQSLYAHVDGADDLRRAIALRGLDELADRLTDAALGRSGSDAIAAIVRAYCAFAIERPGLFDASMLPPGDDIELRDAMTRVMRPLDRVLESYGFDATEIVHWYRILFASVLGFSTMRRNDGYTLGVDVDDTLDRMIMIFTDQLEAERRA